MAKEARGVSLDRLSDYYDVFTPSERSRFRRKQIDLAGLRKGDRVLEVGCGWGLAAVYCAKKYGALVTGSDIDEEVFPFVDLHARINRVQMTTLPRGFDGIRGKDLEKIGTAQDANIKLIEVPPHPRLSPQPERQGR